MRAKDRCIDCNSERCIRQIERLHGSQKGGGGSEVLQMTWSDPCEVNSDAIQMLSLLRVSNVSLESTGVFAFRQHYHLIQYKVAVGKWDSCNSHSRTSPLFLRVIPVNVI